MNDDEDYVSTFLAHAIVYGVFETWYVSTINRMGSSMYAHRYAETLVWEYDPKTRERGRILWQGSDCEFSIRTHMAAIERLYLTGSADEPEED